MNPNIFYPTDSPKSLQPPPNSMPRLSPKPSMAVAHADLQLRSHGAPPPNYQLKMSDDYTGVPPMKKQMMLKPLQP